MKIEHNGWMIESVPKKEGHLWHAWVEVERHPVEDEHEGHIYHFTDIGQYDTEPQATDRGIAWAVAWLDSNY